MTSLRLHILALTIAVSAVGFYFMLGVRAAYDVYAVVLVVGIALISLKDSRYLIIGWFLIAPYFYPTGVEGALNISSNLSHNLFVPFLAVVVIGTMAFRSRNLILGKEDAIFLLFMLYALLSFVLLSSRDYEELRRLYFIYLLPYLLYVVVRNIDIDAHFLRGLALACVFHLVVLSVMCFDEFRTGMSLYTRVLKFGDVGLGRIAGPFGSPIILGVYVSFLFLYLYLSYKLNLVSRIILWFSAIVSGALVVLTFTRSVWLGFVAAAVYLIFKTSQRVSTRFTNLFAFTVLIAIVGALVVSSPEVARRVYDTENPDFRIVMAYAGVNMFLDNPIIGWGVGRFDELKDHYLVDMLGVYVGQDTSHVTLLTIMAELGFIGTILLLLFVAYSLFGKRFGMKDLLEHDRLVVYVSIAFILSFAVNAFLIDMRFFTLAYCLFFMSLGMIQNVYRGHMLASEV